MEEGRKRNRRKYRVRNQLVQIEKPQSTLSVLCGFLILYYKEFAYAFTPLYSSETVSFLRPLARRAANTLRPLAEAILSRKPCLFFLFLLEG
mgnify:CR=1 FL=1